MRTRIVLLVLHNPLVDGVVLLLNARAELAVDQQVVFVMENPGFLDQAHALIAQLSLTAILASTGQLTVVGVENQRSALKFLT